MLPVEKAIAFDRLLPYYVHEAWILYKLGQAAGLVCRSALSGLTVGIFGTL